MKQLSSFFVVVGETPTFSVCETIARIGVNGDVDTATLWRFVIEWDSDHDLRVVDLVNHMIANRTFGEHNVTRIGEASGDVTIWSKDGIDAFPCHYTVNGDQWGVSVNSGPDGMGDAVEAGGRRFANVVVECGQ
jgi:hypothetical protein